MAGKGEKIFKKIFLILVLIGLITGAVFYWKNNQKPQGTVLGAQTSINEAPANPEILVENYFGKPSFLNLKDILSDLKVEVFPEDKISTFPNPALGIGSQIIIKRAILVTVIDAGKPSQYRTFKIKIADFLAEKNIDLAGKDKITPSLDSKITRNLEIKITRVQEAEITQNVAIAFKTINKDDPNLDKGKTRVEQGGKRGSKQQIYKVVRENGQEVSRTLVSEKITQQPQDKIILKGTKEVVLGQGMATWYDWISGLTAASNTLPYGTKVKVTCLSNAKSVVVTIIDYGIKGGAIIDLSADAFKLLAPLGVGVIWVRLTIP